MPVFSCGRSLYIDWRMVVVVGGICPTPCKKEGGIVRAGKCPGEYVRGGKCPREMSYAHLETGTTQSYIYLLQWQMIRSRNALSNDTTFNDPE